MCQVLSLAGEVEAVIETDEAQLRVPGCTCMDVLKPIIAERNGDLCGFRSILGPIPSVHVRRIDPDGPMPPFLLAQFCPFCGKKFLPPSAQVTHERRAN